MQPYYPEKNTALPLYKSHTQNTDIRNGYLQEALILEVSKISRPLRLISK